MTIKDTSVEALAFRPGAEEYGVDILKVQEFGAQAPGRSGVLLLLDIERLMSSEELGMIEPLAA